MHRLHLNHSRLSTALSAAALALFSAMPLAVRSDGGQAPAWVESLTAPRPLKLSGDNGQWLPWDNQYARTRGTFTKGGITKAQGEAWDAQLRAITDFLKQAPVLQHPQGFYPEFSGHVAMVNVGGFEERPKQAPLAGGVALYAWSPRQVRMDAKGNAKLAPGSETRSFRIELNYVYPPRGDVWMQDEQGEFSPLEEQGKIDGFPLIGNALLITRDGRLPFVPVSQQRALNALIAHYEKESQGFEATLAAQRRKAYEDFVSPQGQERRRTAIEAETKKAHPSMVEQVRRKAQAMDRRKEQDLKAEAEKASPTGSAVAEARRRLAAMDETQRRAPAWLLRRQDGQLLNVVAEGTPGAMPLMAFDATFFDPKQPRETLRIASVRELQNVADGVQHDAFPQSVYVALFHQIDWHAFADRFLK